MPTPEKTIDNWRALREHIKWCNEWDLPISIGKIGDVTALLDERDRLAAEVQALREELRKSDERFMAMHASATEWAGQRGVMAGWIGEALETLVTIEPESMDEGWELRALIDSGRRLLDGTADDLLNEP